MQIAELATFFFLSVPDCWRNISAAEPSITNCASIANQITNVTMDAATLNKKRKRNKVEAAADATKKSKKLKNPPPVEPEVEDEVAEEEDEEEEEEEAEAVSNENNIEDGESDAGSDLAEGPVARDVDGDVIPNNSAPILSTLADSQKFEDLKLSEKTMKAIQEMGFTKMTSIQRSVSLPNQSPSPMAQHVLTCFSNRPFHLFLRARTFSVPQRQVPERRSHS